MPLARQDTHSTVSVPNTLAKKKKAEQADLEAKLAAQRQALARKEAELVELKQSLQDEERLLKKANEEAGSRAQRVDVGTLKGNMDFKQVGREMAAAIRRRQELRVNKLIVFVPGFPVFTCTS